MTNREKMMHHIHQAERWQAQAAALEAEAMKAAVKRVEKEDRGQRPEYIAAKILEINFWYRKSTSNRDAHQAQANMYGIAAMVDAVSFPPTIVMEDNTDGRIDLGQAQVPGPEDSKEDEGLR